MLTEANDFRDECDTLSTLLTDASPETFETITQFKSWSIDDIFAHLHLWNYAADLTLQSPEKFHEFFAWVMKRMSTGDTHQKLQRAWFDEREDGLNGPALFDAWREFYPKLAARYRDASPQTRVAWAGPEMSAGAKIIARQMETWSHSQGIFDCLGKTRKEADRVKNIADLGVRTYGWTFRNRGETPPQPKPFIQLTAPSGTVWEWNEVQSDNFVRGDAVEFSQVVTQTRNIADTKLDVLGKNAIAWMAVAQCFAGNPETPPAQGFRRRWEK